MGWWNRLRRRAGESNPDDPIQQVILTLPGWSEEAPQQDMRLWRDSDGDVLTLSVLTGEKGYPIESSESDQRKWCRRLATSRNAGLIEVKTIPSAIGPSLSLIYKRLMLPAYAYTGMLITDVKGVTLVWTNVANEHGMTGVREAFVTVSLMDAGKLTLEDYNNRWAQDPYDPTFGGLDKSVLRFISDDEIYDRAFPQHPLSKVRNVLAALPSSVRCEFLRS